MQWDGKVEKSNLQLPKTVRDISLKILCHENVSFFFKIKKLKQSSPMLPDTAINFT